VIGFLRFIGVMNAAVWLGAAVFFTVGAGPAIFSSDLNAALGHPPNFPYFSGVIAGVVLVRYYYFNLICALVALAHLLGEWLYLGRPGRKFSLGLLLGLLAIVWINGGLLGPHLRQLHTRHYAGNVQPAERLAAGRSFRIWHVVGQFLNTVLIGGLVVRVWRVSNPADDVRFVSSMKFRG